MTKSNCRLSQLISDRKGMTLIEIVVVIGIMAIVTLGTMSLMNQLNRTKLTSQITSSAQMIKQNLYDLLRNDNVWKWTLLGNKSFECICDSDCSKYSDSAIEKEVGNEKQLVIFDSAGGKYFDGVDLKNGFDQSGSICRTFPSYSCPFRLSLTWRTICNNGTNPPTCPTFPQIELKGKIQYDPISDKKDNVSTVPFNSNNHSFTLIKQTDFNLGPPSFPLLDDVETLKKWCSPSSALIKLKLGPDPKIQINSGQPTPPINSLPGSAPDMEGNIKSACAILKSSLSNPEMAAIIKQKLDQLGIKMNIEEFCAGN